MVSAPVLSGKVKRVNVN
ncbi:hypothetical protein IV638_004422, partial [Salmonella enterica]|nr:hypothetical protein [Salmonella enterica]